MNIEKGTENELRRRAIDRLRKQRDFRRNVAGYLAVNAFLVATWWFTGAGFFWPVFLIVVWGIGVVANAWETYRSEGASEEQIQHEIDRLRK